MCEGEWKATAATTPATVVDWASSGDDMLVSMAVDDANCSSADWDCTFLSKSSGTPIS